MIDYKIIKIKKAIRNISLLFVVIHLISYQFHTLLSQIIFFYKEIISLFFIFILYFEIKINKINLLKIFSKKEVTIFFFSYAVFAILLSIHPGSLDPEFYKSSLRLKNISNENLLILYVLKNFIVFMPVVFFFIITNLNKNLIIIFLRIFFFTGIINYFLFTFILIKNNEISFYQFITYNNFYSQTNDFIPIFSIFYSIGLYFSLNSNKENKILKFTNFFLTSFYFYIIFLSSSKASLLFAGLVFFAVTIISFRKKFFYYFIVFKILFICIFHFAINFYLIDENKIKINDNRVKIIENKNNNFYPLLNPNFERLNLTPRYEVLKEFKKYFIISIKRNDLFLIGNGSLSSMFSGFHNDYMRIYYRSGLIGLLSSFFSIFYFLFLFIKFCFENVRFSKDLNLVYLIAVFSSFVPYYSLFAYPRESAYLSGMHWFSLYLIFWFLGKKNSNEI